MHKSLDPNVVIKGGANIDIINLFYILLYLKLKKATLPFNESAPCKNSFNPKVAIKSGVGFNRKSLVYFQKSWHMKII